MCDGWLSGNCSGGAYCVRGLMSFSPSSASSLANETAAIWINFGGTVQDLCASFNRRQIVNASPTVVFFSYDTAAQALLDGYAASWESGALDQMWLRTFDTEPRGDLSTDASQATQLDLSLRNMSGWTLNPANCPEVGDAVCGTSCGGEIVSPQASVIAGFSFQGGFFTGP